MLDFTATPRRTFRGEKWILQNIGQRDLSGDSDINLDQRVLENFNILTPQFNMC